MQAEPAMRMPSCTCADEFVVVDARAALNVQGEDVRASARPTTQALRVRGDVQTTSRAAGQPVRDADAGGRRTPVRTVAWLRARCRVDEATGCWHWRLAVRADGSPSLCMWVDGRKTAMRGRRAAVFIGTGQLPPKGRRAFPVDECTSVDCVNPAHARIGTVREFGRWARRTARWVGLASKSAGARAGWAERRAFTAAQVLAIRASSESDAALAQRWDVSRATIAGVRSGRTYRDVGVRVASVFEWRPG